MSTCIHIAESGRKGLFFCDSLFYSSSGLVKLAKEILPFCFSTVILLSFWHHPLDGTSFLLVRLVFELFFIAHSCLIRTPFFENKYWMLFLELLVIAFSVSFEYPISRLKNEYPISRLKNDSLMSFMFVCQLVFVVSTMHKLVMRTFFKMILDFVVIVCFCYVLVGYTDGVAILILYYINVIVTTGLLLIIYVIKYLLPILYHKLLKIN